MTTTIKPTTALVTAKPSAINLMASRLSVEPAKLYDTLKSTVFQKATNEELLALVVVANEYGLNPFLKELYAFPEGRRHRSHRVGGRLEQNVGARANVRRY